MGINEINILSLAYLGDSVYELKVRDYLISTGISKVNKLQKEAMNFVTAKKQCEFINYFIENNILTETEIDYVKRGRNASTYSHPKNTDIVTYKWATGFECLFGYLYLDNNKERIDELFNIILEVLK
ncbi:MAG: Mini-ribonuclease 3 [Bacilli bacterium]|jgi:ribonuclease-3 family protein|nr:Mini-ribonuclease 3 [Bacilli bacterium]